MRGNKVCSTPSFFFAALDFFYCMHASIALFSDHVSRKVICRLVSMHQYASCSLRGVKLFFSQCTLVLYTHSQLHNKGKMHLDGSFSETQLFLEIMKMSGVCYCTDDFIALMIPVPAERSDRCVPKLRRDKTEQSSPGISLPVGAQRRNLGSDFADCQEWTS
jgi:hypothetical protein